MECEIFSNNENDKLLIPKLGKIKLIKEDEHFYLLKITKNTNDFASTENEYILKDTYYKVYLLF
jgi:hypothetical protein